MVVPAAVLLARPTAAPVLRAAVHRCHGDWRDGDWRNGDWRDGDWRDGDWRDGDWRDGNWRRGDGCRGDWCYCLRRLSCTTVAAAIRKDGELCNVDTVVRAVGVETRAPQVVVNGAVFGGELDGVPVACWVKVTALLHRDERVVFVWAQATERERCCILDVVVVHADAVAVRGDAEVAAASIELRQDLVVSVLPFAVQCSPVESFANFGRV